MGCISLARVESIILESGCVEDGNLVDKTVLEYILDVLQETDDTDEIHDVLGPMIEDLWCEGHCADVIVEALIDAKNACREDTYHNEAYFVTSQRQKSHDTNDERSLEGKEKQDDDDGGEEGNNNKEGENTCNTLASCLSEEQVCAIGMLASLLSLDDGEEAHRNYLLDVYMSCGSNMEATADVLLAKTESEIQRGIEARETQSGRENTPPSVDPDIKASIVSKYHLQAVSSRERGTSSTRQRKKESEFMMKGVFAGKQKSAVRFRDGAVVTTKGEKYITEKKEEWDGGSRGRVKSKGKRGVGWI